MASPAPRASHSRLRAPHAHRTARSALLAKEKFGELTAQQIFERDDEVAKKARAMQVLRALPGYGAAKVATRMTACEVDEKRRVGGLTSGQRTRLIEALA